MSTGAVRRVQEEELPLLQEIERAAGQCFAEIGMDFVAADAPPSVEALREFQRGGRAWVWVDVDDRPMAYLLAEVVDENAHLEQVSVHPDVAHRRIGQTLIEHLQQWAREQGLPAITMTTYTDVAWNGPYYQRLGFRYLDMAEMSPGLRRIREEEIAHGLDQWPRACMRLDL